MRAALVSFLMLASCQSIVIGDTDSVPESTTTDAGEGPGETSTGTTTAGPTSTTDPVVTWCPGSPCSRLADCGWPSGGMVCTLVDPAGTAGCLERCTSDTDCETGRCMLITFDPEEIHVCWDGVYPIPEC